MHIVEGYLPFSHAVAWTAISAPFAVHSARAVRQAVDTSRVMRMRLAASGAFVLLLSSLKLPSVAGSSSHPTGTGLGSVLVGAAAMPTLAGLVLLFQAILLAHGGLTTLGANLFSLGVVGPWMAVGTYRLMVRVRCSAVVAAGCAATLADLATYATTSLQLALAFPQSQGGVTAAFLKFAAVFAFTQLPLAALEGVFTSLVWRALHGVETTPAPRSA
ncbi:MAG: energy-coupling factor ABC transporter permease [Gemmatimonadetes bacterium]|nr:energy-coupling factor ABC transporter permease [Gemmatimonadota bacterium]